MNYRITIKRPKWAITRIKTFNCESEDILHVMEIVRSNLKSVVYDEIIIKRIE